MSGTRLYQRHIRPALEAAIGDTPVAILVGPRQSGKSTLAGEIAAERGARHVTLDEPAQRAAAMTDPTGFIDGAELPLFIDEVQKAPDLLDAIKARVDRERSGGRRPAGLFLLTGSANVWATLRISEALAGRAERIQLWPLSQGEIEGRREAFLRTALRGEPSQVRSESIARSSVSARLAIGGFPEMVARSKADRRDRWVESYLEMLLERDVRDLAKNAQQLDQLRRLLSLLAARVAGLLEISGLATDAGLKRDTTARYLALLELLFLIRRTPAWSRNLGQRLIKAPKVWLTDSGLAFHLLGYDGQRFDNDETAIAGALFENFVASELIKQSTWTPGGVRLSHFRTAGGREVDIVLESRDGRVAGVEVKLAATPSESDFRGLRHLRDRIGENFRSGILIYTGSETLSFGDRLWATPVSALWS